MSKIQVEHDPRFSAIADLVSANVDSGADIGASVAVTLNGNIMVDFWTGCVDESRTTPWQSDTITHVWSSAKNVNALATLVLVDLGDLGTLKPVAQYWPELSANGKVEIEVRHLLSHT